MAVGLPPWGTILAEKVSITAETQKVPENLAANLSFEASGVCAPNFLNIGCLPPRKLGGRGKEKSASQGPTGEQAANTGVTASLTPPKLPLARCPSPRHSSSPTSSRTSRANFQSASGFWLPRHSWENPGVLVCFLLSFERYHLVKTILDSLPNPGRPIFSLRNIGTTPTTATIEPRYRCYWKC